jgi:hypothetical protein
MHPGAVQYRNTDEALRDFTMTSAIIWLAMEEEMHLAGSELPKPKLCEIIILRVSARTGPDTKFRKAYQNAKNC